MIFLLPSHPICSFLRRWVLVEYEPLLHIKPWWKASVDLDVLAEHLMHPGVRLPCSIEGILVSIPTVWTGLTGKNLGYLLWIGHIGSRVGRGKIAASFSLHLSNRECFHNLCAYATPERLGVDVFHSYQWGSCLSRSACCYPIGSKAQLSRCPCREAGMLSVLRRYLSPSPDLRLRT